MILQQKPRCSFGFSVHTLQSSRASRTPRDDFRAKVESPTRSVDVEVVTLPKKEMRLLQSKLLRNFGAICVNVSAEFSLTF